MPGIKVCAWNIIIIIILFTPNIFITPLIRYWENTNIDYHSLFAFCTRMYIYKIKQTNKQGTAMHRVSIKVDPGCK